MSTIPVKAPPITVEQYEGFEGFPGLRDELIYGEIVMSPQPKPLQQQISENIHNLLRAALADQPYVAKRNSNIKFMLTDSMPVPDAFVLPRDVWYQACEQNQYVSVPPILVVEVFSPSNRQARVREKVRLYVDNGVHEVWEVHSEKHNVRVHRPAGQGANELSESQTIILPHPTKGELLVRDMFRMD